MPDGASRDALAACVAALRAGPDAPPGVVLGVVTGEQARWHTDGVAQAFDDNGPLPHPAPITPQTSTDLGSVTKIVATTTALMTFADAGEIDLDRRVGAVLPEFADRAIAAAPLSDLLEHRAGLWEWWPLYLSPGVSSDPSAALDVATSLPLRYAPGAARHYSDLGFQLLGAVVARLGGSASLDPADIVTQRVLLPWGLAHTRYAAPVPGTAVAASSTGDRIEQDMVRTGNPYPVVADVDSFAGWRRHVLVGEVNDGNACHAFGGVAGHAGLFSTADDLARYGAGLLRCLAGDGPIGADTAHHFVRAGADPGQALGFRRWPSSVPGCDAVTIGHTGFPGVAMAVLPEHDATVVLVTNRLHVPGAARLGESMWHDALDAAHRRLH